MTDVPEVNQVPLPAVTRLARWAPLAVLEGTSLALGGWAWGHRPLLLDYIGKNDVDPVVRRTLLLGMAVAGLVSAIAYLVARRRVGDERVERWLRIGSPVLVTGILPFLLEERAWVGKEVAFLVAIGLSALLLRWTLEASLTEAELQAPFLLPAPLAAVASSLRRRFGPALRTRGPLLVAFSASAFYALYFGIKTTTSHYNFCTSAFDLGIEHNLVWGAAHGEPLFRSAPLGGGMRHGGYHQTYFAYVLAPIYRLFSSAETLLWIQSIFLGAAAIPFFLYARRRIGEWAAAALAVLYVFYGPLHGANLYDFHYQPFGVFFIFTAAYLLERESYRWLVVVALLTFSVREDMGAMMSALGGFFLLTGRRPRAGLVLAVTGATYFVLLKLYIMPVFFLHGESSFAFMFKDLVPAGENGFGAVLKTVFGNPGYALDTLLTRDKLFYILQIFVPVAFLALRRSWGLVLFAPASVFTLLATGYAALIMTTFQYTCYWTPMVFLAVVESLERVPVARDSARVWRVACLGAMTFAMLVSSNRFGVLFQEDMARGAFDPVRLTSRPEDHQNHADFQALNAKVPRDAKVVAAEWLVSHVAGRRDAYTLRFGVLDAEYLLFWTHPEKLRADEKKVLREALLGRNAPFGVVETRGLFVLAKRGVPKDKNKSLRGRI